MTEIQPRKIKVCPECGYNQIKFNGTRKNWSCYAPKHRKANKDKIFRFKKPKELMTSHKIVPKRNPMDLDILSPQQLVAKIRNMKTNNLKRDKAFVAFLYLSGARISEVVKKVRKNQIDKTLIKDQWHVVINNLTILKRRKKINRTIPILVRREHEIFEFLAKYLDSIRDIDTILFNFSREYGHRIIKTSTELFPHFLRHLRITHLVTIYGFNPLDLVQFTGWADPRPTTVYAHLDWQSLAKKMRGTDD